MNHIKEAAFPNLFISGNIAGRSGYAFLSRFCCFRQFVTAYPYPFMNPICIRGLGAVEQGRDVTKGHKSGRNIAVIGKE
ncbi:hypothetical protein [Alloalcanivorax xenomutans]|uniref:hypothetical protein n=1 Tax=Alloalcanivorax xenomutans TaxID=1094342 RepID=UPI00292F9283|nr:hypothetical protein [Alloalcanivorax xenomutans]WOA32384.1 hypothetical protein RVY87_04730 [Alloalcanivorax xenomutans]